MLLELKGVKKYFESGRQGLWGKKSLIRAVDNVDLFLEKGDHLGLVGESGSGKTTLGRVILGLYRMDEGEMSFEDRETRAFSKAEKTRLVKNIQMVFQDPYSSLDPRYTVRGLLGEADERVNPVPGREDRMRKILSDVGLPVDILGRFPHEFSGGERQRIAIARALMMNPKLLILDEAVSSLDVLIQAQILDLLKSLKERYDVTYLFISHNLRVVRKLCSSLAVMYKGRIVERGPAEEILARPLHPYTRELLAAAVDYKAVTRKESIPLSEKSSLIDKGKGHFVIN